MTPFNGLGMHLGNLSRLSSARTRSISPENFSGAKGGGGMASEGTGAHAARELGHGWKLSPSVKIGPGECHELADIRDSGAIQHIWLTPTGNWRSSILRIYWDDQEQPSVECPVGDFFACGWGKYAQLSSLAVCVNPGSAFNCYWEMPFRRRCRITLTNIADEPMVLYYQITYALTEVPEDAAYFHAQFRRVNPLPYKEVYPILDGVQEAPTICGTGTEDYFCGSYNFDVGKEQGGYREFTTPYAGLPQVLRPDGLYQSQTRFGMYRWHITDPIRFAQDLRVTIQALGWRSGHRYLPLQDDIASVAYWYQTLPTAPFPALPDRDGLEII
jgi:hypothetical protein